MPREPFAVVLVARLVAERHAVLHHDGVAAHVEDRGQPALGFFRAVKIRRHIESGRRVVVQFLDDEAVALHLAGLRDFQRRALRHRVEAEHLRELLFHFRARRLPLFSRGRFGERIAVNVRDLARKRTCGSRASQPAALRRRQPRRRAGRAAPAKCVKMRHEKIGCECSWRLLCCRVVASCACYVLWSRCCAPTAQTIPAWGNAPGSETKNAEG